jgi:hypothetical protein
MAGLAQLLAEKGIRADGVRTGRSGLHSFLRRRPNPPSWNSAKNVPMKRPGQPAELATAYVMLADPRSSYVSGARIAVTAGGKILSDRLQSRGGQPTEPRTTMLATAEPSFAARPAYVSRGNFAIVVIIEGN